MSGALRPIALTCGEPAGIGAEIAVLARTALPDLPFFWLGDPRHLAQGTPLAETRLCPRACCPCWRIDLRAKPWRAYPIRQMHRA